MLDDSPILEQVFCCIKLRPCSGLDSFLRICITPRPRVVLTLVLFRLPTVQKDNGVRKLILRSGLLVLMATITSCVAVAPRSPPVSGVELLRLVRSLVDGQGLSDSIFVKIALHINRKTEISSISCGKRSYPDGGMKVYALRPSWFHVSEDGSNLEFKLRLSKVQGPKEETAKPLIIYEIRDAQCRELNEPLSARVASLDFINVQEFSCITDDDVASVMPDVGPSGGYVDAVPDLVYGPHLIAKTNIRAIFWSAPNYSDSVKKNCLGSIEILQLK